MRKKTCQDLPAVWNYPYISYKCNFGKLWYIKPYKKKFILHFIYNDFYFYSCNCNEMFLSDFHCLVDQLQKEA